MRQHFLLVYLQVTVHAASNQGIPKLSLFFTIWLSYSCSSKSKESGWLPYYSKLWINSLCFFWFSELYFLAVHISEWGSRGRRDNVIPSTLHVSRYKGMKTFPMGLVFISGWRIRSRERKQTLPWCEKESGEDADSTKVNSTISLSYSKHINQRHKRCWEEIKKYTCQNKNLATKKKKKQQSSWTHKTYRTKHTEHTAFAELVEFSLPSSIMNFLCREVKSVST